MATKNLAEDDLGALHDALYEVRKKYVYLGLQIGVKKNEIDNIEVEHGDNSRRLLEVLEVRVKRDPALTWADIEKALRSQSVDEHQTADRIQQSHGSKSDPGSQGNSDDLGTRDERKSVTKYTSHKKEHRSDKDAENMLIQKHEKPIFKSRSSDGQTGVENEFSATGEALSGTTSQEVKERTPMFVPGFHQGQPEQESKEAINTQLQSKSVSHCGTTDYSIIRKFHSETKRKRQKEHEIPQSHKKPKRQYSVCDSEEENQHISSSPEIFSRGRKQHGEGRGEKRERVSSGASESPPASSTYSSLTSPEVRAAKADEF